MTRSISVRTVLVLIGFLATGLDFSRAVAVDDRSIDESANAITIYTKDPANQALATQLLARARQRGEIRVIIGLDLTMRDETTLTAAEQAAQLSHLRLVQDQVRVRALNSPASDRIVEFDTIPFVSAWVNAAQLERLLIDVAVVSIQEDIPVPPGLNQSTRIIQADDLWSKPYNGLGIVVAILDTGADKRHAMLSRRIISEACYSTNNGANIRSVCPGGVTELVGPGAGKNCPLSVSGCDHGTHVASIAAGWDGRNKGVAYSAKLIIVQVFTRFNQQSECGALPAPCVKSYSTDQVKGLERVYQLRRKYTIAAANMSLGGGAYAGMCDSSNTALSASITKLRAQRIATVIASGNDGHSGYIGAPACISSAVAVGSSTKTDGISSFSNHAPLVKVLAPGSDINAARAGSEHGLTPKSGTSMAAPHVAGAFALLRDFKESATVNEIVTALICTGKLLKRSGYDLKKPRIQLLDAWRYLRRPPTQSQRWDFSDPTDADDWDTLLGTWRVVSGHWALRAFAAGTPWNASWHPNCNEKLTVTARMLRVDSQNNQTIFYNSGLILKAAVDKQTKSVSGYWFAYNGSDGSPPKAGQAVIWRMDNYNMATRSGGSTLLCTKDEAGVTVGGYNELKVVSNGPRHLFYLNGSLVCSVTDATYIAGSIGLAVAIPNPVVGTQNFKVDWAEITPHRSALDEVAGANAVDASIHPAQFMPRQAPAGVSPVGMSR
jgi:subtilisin family serine protease